MQKLEDKVEALPGSSQLAKSGGGHIQGITDATEKLQKELKSINRVIQKKGDEELMQPNLSEETINIINTNKEQAQALLETGGSELAETVHTAIRAIAGNF